MSSTVGTQLTGTPLLKTAGGKESDARINPYWSMVWPSAKSNHPLISATPRGFPERNPIESGDNLTDNRRWSSGTGWAFGSSPSTSISQSSYPGIAGGVRSNFSMPSGSWWPNVPSTLMTSRPVSTLITAAVIVAKRRPERTSATSTK